jgi:putative ATPase
MLGRVSTPSYVAWQRIRLASEDVGNADPRALSVAVAAKDVVHFIGMPEGNTALAQAVIYSPPHRRVMPCCMHMSPRPKPPAEDIAERVPLHLRNAPTKLMTDLGSREGLSLRAR